MWGNVPGGYRNTVNKNVVLIEMIEMLIEDMKDTCRDRSYPRSDRHLCRQRRPGQLLGLQDGDTRLRAVDQHSA